MTAKPMSYYTLNVAMAQPENHFDGRPYFKHLFATAKHSIRSRQEADALAIMFQEKFPAPLFEISLTYWAEIGTGLPMPGGAR